MKITKPKEHHMTFYIKPSSEEMQPIMANNLAEYTQLANLESKLKNVKLCVMCYRYGRSYILAEFSSFYI